MKMATDRQTLSIKDFTQKSAAAKLDRILMTNSLNAHSDAAISVQDFCSSVIRPLIESLSLNYSVLTPSEYDALETKGAGTFYILKEQGRIIRTYIGQNPLTDGETFLRIVDDFWQVSYDGGITYAHVLDNNGMKISAKGDKVMLRLTETGIEYRYESEPDTKYRELVSLDKLKLKFTDLTVAQKEEIRGKNIYLQKGDTHIRWRIGEDGQWTDLVALAELKGDKGDAAVLRRNDDYIQTKNEGGVWEDLYNIREVAGAVEIVNEPGERTDAAVSQKLLTDSLAGLSSSLGGLSNVDPDADNEPAETRLLVQKYGSKTWDFFPFSKLPSGGGGGEGGGATTLGGLTNVLSDVDLTLDDDFVLVKMAGMDMWTMRKMSEFGSAGGGGGEGGIMYNLYIRNNMESLGFATQYGEECVIDFTFVSQYRETSNKPYKPTGEMGLCTIMIKNAKYTDFTVIRQMEVSSGVSIRQEISEFLSAGSNSVKITVKGENTDKTTAPVTYTVQLTSLGVSAPNFAWWTAFAGDITIPMMISGNVSKMLHVTVTGKDYNQTYDVSLGTAIYTDTPYNYVIPHPGATGIYNISFYLSNSDNTLQTRAVSVNVMCTATAGESVKLMCVNNVAGLLTNWQDNTVFDYAVYDGQAATTDVLFSITRDGEEVYSSENNAIPTNARQTLTYPMEVETDDDADFHVRVSATGSDGGDGGTIPLIDPITLPVNNSLGYSATAGAVFYLNPRTRGNSQTNHESIINEADKTVVPVEWNNFNWGNDGWTADGDGVKALKIFARSKAVIDYRPFATEAARKGKTVEIDFRVENASDTSKDIITIAGGNVGLRVSGENVSFFSQSRHESSTQDVPIDNGVRIRLTVVVMPDAYGNAGFNLVAIYINGRKNRQYAYENNDYFRNDGQIVLGNDYANLYLYGLRVYDAALTSEAVQKNYINQLVTTDEKQAEKSVNEVLDGEGVNIDFNATRLLYNVFLIDKRFPSLMNPSGVAGNLKVYFKDKPERNFTLTNLLVEGQGTSSKKYLEWNIRFKLKGLKDADGNKIASIATYADGTTDKNKVLMFDGVPKSGRLTAKKNWASSMQDHKAGSVDAYDSLYKEMGMRNEAMTADPQIRVAVYQEPFIGFSKSVNEEGQDVYTCMGEFTFGPDKGDDLCFGYDTSAFPELLSVEGSDNAPLGALFRVPWNRNKSYWAYNPDEEAFQYNDTNCWDFDAGELNADETEPLSAQRWIDAYNAVYLCSNRIRPFTGTLAELNAAVAEYRSTGYEYWIAKAGDADLYHLYYFEAAESRFIPSDTGAGPINLQTQLKDYLNDDLSAFTAEQLNELFINARKQLFRATVPALFDMDDTVFHYCFTEFTAGTDQRAKNTYPYNFCTAGSKWRWRLDDADTIFPIDNQGQDRKPYHCEMHDTYSNGQPIWNGETSVFWNMLELAFSAEITAGMRKMLSAMESLCGQSSGTPYDKVYAFYKKYYLGVKNYFPATLVNADAKRYEIAKIAYNNGSYTNDTDPITQSHGDFYSAETAWVKKRIMYIMSKYNYGLFSADGTDTVIVRAAGDLIDYEITPAFDMYPAIANGTSIVQGARTKAGQVCRMTIDLGGSADQQNAIQAASWLLSIGDWHNKNVSGTMVVRGRRLTELILGSKTESVTISITGLTLADCGSMQRVLLSNISTLQGTLNLSALENIREVYADGTSLSQLKLPEGGGLERIEYPAGNRYLTLRNFPVLTARNVIIDQCASVITDFFITGCPMLNPMDVLVTILNAQASQGIGHALKRIRAVGFDSTYTDTGSQVLDMLGSLTDGTYEGLNADGLAGEDPYPVLDGKITVRANAYEDTVNALRERFTKLTLVIDGAWYIRFADKVVQNIVAANWGDGAGITKEQAAKVTTLGNKFQGNSEITSFDEFEYFTGINPLKFEALFYQCTTLSSIRLPKSIATIGKQCFDGCVQLKDTGDIKHLEIILDNGYRGTALQGNIDISGCKNIGYGAFWNCKKITEFSFSKSLTEIGSNAFLNCTSLKTINIPNGIAKIEEQLCRGCSSLETVTIPNSVTYIRRYAFRDCVQLQFVRCEAATPPTIEYDVFYNTNNCPIYVPTGSITTYKSATNWSNYASRIQAIPD